tara:strand:- start:377 stop:601 length:225 start_codon:yes stop_codon:yes gene_type:complete
MNRKQEKFLDNMTPAQAEAVIAKFKGDPAIAADRSDAAYHAFKLAWEMLNPDEYWQRHDRARADGGVQFHLISS